MRQFYERVALSRNKASMLTKAAVAKPQGVIAPEEAIKDPYVLEFLELKDEYSETQLEAALIARLQTFLLDLCASKGTALARYALEGLPNKVLAAEYRTALPDEELLAAKLDRTRQLLAPAKSSPK